MNFICVVYYGREVVYCLKFQRTHSTAASTRTSRYSQQRHPELLTSRLHVNSLQLQPVRCDVITTSFDRNEHLIFKCRKSSVTRQVHSLQFLGKYTHYGGRYNRRKYKWVVFMNSTPCIVVGFNSVVCCILHCVVLRKSSCL